MCANNGFYLNVKFYCDIACVLLYCQVIYVKEKVLECCSGMNHFEKEAPEQFSSIFPNLYHHPSPPRPGQHTISPDGNRKAFVVYLIIKLYCQHMVVPLAPFCRAVTYVVFNVAFNLFSRVSIDSFKSGEPALQSKIQHFITV